MVVDLLVTHFTISVWKIKHFVSHIRFRILEAMRVDIRTFCSAMKLRAANHFLKSVLIY
jgi:hypothetical protein